MKKVVGGSIAIILGLFCLSVFFPSFLKLLEGVIPILLILGGCLAIYLKHEDQKNSTEATDGWKDTGITDAPLTETPVEKGSDRVEAEKIKPIESEKTKTEKLSGEMPKLLGNTGSLVFHHPDCKYSTSKNCTAVFNTREDALQEGYKPCGTCNP